MLQKQMQKWVITAKDKIQIRYMEKILYHWGLQNTEIGFLEGQLIPHACQC